MLLAKLINECTRVDVEVVEQMESEKPCIM